MSILYVRLSNSLWGSDVLLILEFINIVFIVVLYLYWIHYIFIYFLVISFSQYKEYMSCLISFNKFLDVLIAFTCGRAINNLWSISLGVNILSRVAMSKGRPLAYVDLIGNISLLKALRVHSLPSYTAYALS